MMLRKWEQLPENMRVDAVRPYYEHLRKKKGALLAKRIFDVTVSALLLLILSPVFLVLMIAIKLDSPGPIFYRQERVGRYGKTFRIFKFRTMVKDADKGSLVTVGNDSRITRVGRLIRKCRLDEISQLLDVFRGTMTFVGTRPEVAKYVDAYTPEMMATLLMAPGVTAMACIFYKDEAEILGQAEDVDQTYQGTILPQKMRYNLDDISRFGFWRDIKIMFMTVLAVLGVKFSSTLPVASGK